MGLLRAVGKPRLGMWLKFVFYWLVAAPLAPILCYTLGMGLFGVWTGLDIGMVAVAIVATIFVLKLDWHALAVEAKQRNAAVPSENGADDVMMTKFVSSRK